LTPPESPLPAAPRLNAAQPRPARDHHPPEHPPACCTQHTITIPPNVAAKTRQKHDYPSAAWRRSCRRRTSAERANATIKDTASNNIARGWCRLTGLSAITLWIACLLVIRNQRVADSCQARQQDDARRAAAGLPRAPANGAAPASPSSPPGRHNQQQQPAPRQPSRSADTSRPRPSAPESAASASPGTPPATTMTGKPPAERTSDPDVNMDAGEM
jgi:hypothetical protein